MQPGQRFLKLVALSALLITAGTLGLAFAPHPLRASPASFTLFGRISPPAGWGSTASNVASPGPDLTVTAGETVTMTLNSGDGFTHNWGVDYNGNGLPDPGEPLSSNFGSSGTTYTFAATTTPGTYTYWCFIHKGPMHGSFIVQTPPPDFSISASPTSVSVAQGSSTTSTINLASLNGFAGTVTVNSVSSPTGLPLSPATTMVTLAAGGTGSFVLTFLPTTATAAGAYTVTASGTSGSLSHSTTVTVTVVGPDFSISASPAAPASFVAGNSATSTITASSMNGFAGSVSLAATTTSPVTGLTFMFNPTSVPLASGGTGTSTLTIATTASTPAGTYTITVTGTAMGGSPSHSATVGFTVVAPDFGISPNPMTLSIVQGSSGNSTITLTSLNGFSGSVSLTFTITPNGPSVTLNPPTVTLSSSASGQSTVHVSTSSGIYSSTPLGPYTVSVTGTSGTISHSISVAITVTSGTSSAGNLPTYAIVGIAVAIVAAVVIAILAIRRGRPKK